LNTQNFIFLSQNLHVGSNYNREQECKIKYWYYIHRLIQFIMFYNSQGCRCKMKDILDFYAKNANGIIQTNSQSGIRDYVKQLSFIQVFYLEPFYMSFRAILF
jgi:hypothetical protein